MYKKTGLCLLIFSFFILFSSFVNGAVYKSTEGGLSIPSKPVNEEDTYDSLSSVSHVSNYSDGSATQMDITLDGSYLLRNSDLDNDITSFSLSTNHNLSSSSRTEVSSVSYSNLDTSGDDSQIRSVSWNTNGDKLFVQAQSSPDHLFSYSLSTQWDVATQSGEDYVTLSEIDSIRGSHFTNDGSDFYAVHDDVGQEVSHYSLSTPYDISTATHINTKDISSNIEGAVYGISVDNNGQTMFIVDRNVQEIEEYNMTNSHDLTSASHEYTLDVSANVADVSDVAVSFNGSTMNVFAVDYRSGYARYN